MPRNIIGDTDFILFNTFFTEDLSEQKQKELAQPTQSLQKDESNHLKLEVVLNKFLKKYIII